MTEQEWLSSSGPNPMLEFLRDRTSDRKLRLFAVACCRRIWHLLLDSRSRKAVDVAELSADGLADVRQLEKALEAAHEAAYDVQVDAPGGDKYMDVEIAAPCDAVIEAAGNDPAKAAFTARQAVLYAAGHTWGGSITAELQAIEVAETTAQAALLREFFGNPFRPVTLYAPWVTSTVKQLAESIYTDRQFDRMPFLADALEDAGCDNADILNHCRQPGEHIRGCWLLDLILGKERHR